MDSHDIVGSNIAYHDRLSPVAWRADGTMRLPVQVSLLRTARLFVDYLDIPNFRLTDVVLTGSMANYNYTDHSDFDLHIITRYSDLDCDDLAESLYQAKKSLWNDRHDITIGGHDVELYVEDAADPPVSQGIYSLLRDRWLRQPEHSQPNIDRAAVKRKALDLMNQIDRAISTADSAADLERMRHKIWRMRQSGLDRAGEFGTENLAFKILRNQGYLDRLLKNLTQQQDRAISV